MEKWSINEVCDFLSENDFEEDIVECFRVNKIRGRVLFLLSEDDMKQLGLDALGDRKYFQHILHNKRDKEKAENMKKEDAIVESSTSTHPSKSLRSDVTARDQVKRTPDTTGSHSSFWQPDDVGTSATVGNTTMEFDRAADEEDSDYDFMLDSQDFSDEDDNTENTPSGSAGANNIADRSSSISLGSQKPLADTENRAPLVAFLEKHQPLSISLESLPFHDSVITSLKERRLVGRTRSKFVTEIAKAMIRLKNYPGKKDYDRVARQIVSKWKFLGEQVGHDFLVEALRNRMKNLRQMVQHKNDPFHRRRLSTKTRPVKPSHQMPTPPPLAIPLRKEDRPRHDGYVSELLRECKCVPPIKQKVESLMHATFPFRRYDILENVLSFDELLLTYPPLKDPAELGREFNRVMRCDVVSHIRTTWKALCAKIIAVGKQEAVENYHIFKLLSNLPSDMPEGRSKDEVDVL
ncbi:uncharacterized protein [Dysidea avara]|uniref:uncharacterized protein isoform X2 n=1 Tax=Dysidea avara TaxID=196820 RepID=UPI0033342358